LGAGLLHSVINTLNLTHKQGTPPSCPLQGQYKQTLLTQIDPMIN